MARHRPPRGAGDGLLRPPRPEGVPARDDMIAALVELDTNGLCLQWRNHLGGTPPAHLPRWLLMKILSKFHLANQQIGFLRLSACANSRGAWHGGKVFGCGER